MGHEIAQRLCMYCRHTFSWLWRGERLKDGSKIYCDDQGLRWSGRRCPGCERQRVLRALKADPFQRHLILEALRTQGYEILTPRPPYRVKSPDSGRELTIGVVHACAQGRDLTVNTEEAEEGPGCDLYVMVFQSVRLCTPAQIQRIQGNQAIDPSRQAAAPLRETTDLLAHIT